MSCISFQEQNLKLEGAWKGAKAQHTEVEMTKLQKILQQLVLRLRVMDAKGMSLRIVSQRCGTVCIRRLLHHKHFLQTIANMISRNVLLLLRMDGVKLSITENFIPMAHEHVLHSTRVKVHTSTLLSFRHRIYVCCNKKFLRTTNSIFPQKMP